MVFVNKHKPNPNGWQNKWVQPFWIDTMMCIFSFENVHAIWPRNLLLRPYPIGQDLSTKMFNQHYSQEITPYPKWRLVKYSKNHAIEINHIGKYNIKWKSKLQNYNKILI